MSLKASRAPSNQVSSAPSLTLAILRPAGFAAGKKRWGRDRARSTLSGEERVTTFARPAFLYGHGTAG